jgi:hypothetical protein
MSTQPATKEVQTPVESPNAYDNVGKVPKSQRTVKEKVEKVKPTEKQENSLTLAVQLAQQNTRNAKVAIVRDASSAIAGEILNDIQAATSMELVTRLSETLTGEYGARNVLRGFLSTTTTSTFQPLDEVAKLETTTPIALQMFQELNLLPAA